VKKLFLSFLLLTFSSSSFADTFQIKKKYYTSKGIEVEDVYVPNTTLFKYQGKSGFDAKTQGCSAIASLYSQLGLSKNLDAVKNVFDNWKSIVLPAAIYALALQSPYVKEALVSSQFISDFLAQVGGTSCESVFNFINKVNGVSKEKIAECMERNKDCYTSSDPNKCFLERCGVHKSWYELVSGKTFSDLLKDDKALQKVNEVLAMVNPGTAFDCAMGLSHPVSTSMTKEQFDEDVRELVANKGMSEIEAKTLLILRATIPKVSISSSGMGLDVPKIDGKVLTLSRGLKLLQEDVLKDLSDLLNDVSTATSTEEVKKKVQDFADKYGIKVSLDNYFVLLRKINYKLQKDCPATTSGAEVIPADEEKRACIKRTLAFNQAKEKLTKIISSLYAQKIKEAMLRYVNQTKVYLLQNKGKGVAVCSKLSGKKIDTSPEAVKTMLSQLDALKDQVKTEVDDYLETNGVKDLKKAELEVVKLLATAVDGKEHKEGDRIEVTIE